MLFELNPSRQYCSLFMKIFHCLTLQSLSTETFERFCARTDAKRKTLLLPQYGAEAQHRGTSMVETCKQDPDEPEDSHLNRVQSTVIPR